MLCSVYSVVYVYVNVSCGVVYYCAYLQIEMCKRNHEACHRQVPRDHQVIGVIMLDFYVPL